VQKNRLDAQTIRSHHRFEPRQQSFVQIRGIIGEIQQMTPAPLEHVEGKAVRSGYEISAPCTRRMARISQALSPLLRR